MRDVGGEGDDRTLVGLGGRQMPGLVASTRQGLTLVHFSAQLERFLWDRGCA